MIQKIHELRRKKYTIEQIAVQLGMTVGQVKYRLYKKPSQEDEIRQDMKEEAVEQKECPPLPLYYGTDEIHLMVQGPTTLFAYWEITWSQMGMLSDFLNTPYEHIKKQLRIYDVTDIWFDGGNAHAFRDILIPSFTDNWFVYDVLPGRTYLVDIGVIWEERFVPFLRSKPKNTPRNEEAGAWSPLVPNVGSEAKERIKPRWFENFSAYTVY